MLARRVTASDEVICADQDLAPWRAAKAGARFPWVSVAIERWKTSVPSAESLDALLPPAVRGALGVDGRVLLVRRSSEALDARLIWRVQASPPLLASAPVEVLDLQDNLFFRVDGAMAGRESLRKWRVVVVGLGSLGGTVAVHLARSGVSRFALFDPDMLRPENVVRHSAGIPALFLPKVEAVRNAILNRNPWAVVDAYPSSPLWDGTLQASFAFETLLGEPDTLVIVTTADHAVEHAINELAVQHVRPALFASVLGHADHGRVFRVLPGETPCYQCVIDGQLARPGRFFRQEDDGETQGPALEGYRQPGVPGTGIDVDLVAAHTARFALQTLSRLNGGLPTYPDAPGHHLVWTNRGGSDFDGPLQARWEPYGRRAGCPVCGSAHEAPWDESDHQSLRALEREMADPRRMAPDVPILGDSPTPKENSHE
jgi:molybdopterin/thiamine biosynthesis adenylyltransferase